LYDYVSSRAFPIEFFKHLLQDVSFRHVTQQMSALGEKADTKHSNWITRYQGSKVDFSLKP